MGQGKKKYKEIRKTTIKADLGAPKLVELTCKNCGATLTQTDETHAECQYCKKIYLIDQPEDVNISIFVNKDSGLPIPTVKENGSLLSVWISVAVFVFIILGLALLSHVGEKKNEKKPIQTLFYESVFNKKQSKITKEEFADIKYLRYDTAKTSTKPIIEYSFTDYKSCASEEEFQSTIQTWAYGLSNYRNELDLSALTGVTRIDAGNNTKLLTAKLSKENPVTYLESTKKLSDILPMFQPEGLLVLHLYGSTDSLTGIEQCKNLTELYAKGHGRDEIIDVKGISGCKKLQRLIFDGTSSFYGLAELSELTELTELKIEGVALRIIGESLKKMTKLQKLTVDLTAEDDVSVLNTLTGLTYLSFGGTEEFLPESISALNGLTYLKGSIGCKEDFDALSVFTNMKDLSINLSFIDFSYNDMVDARALLGMEQLQSLVISTFFGNDICNAEVFFCLPNLETLHLTGRSISSVGLFADSSKLKKQETLRNLKMEAYVLKDPITKENLGFSFLENFPELTTLSLKDYDLTDISFIRSLPKLTACNLEENKLIDYSPLLVCKDLKTVYIYGNTSVDTGLPEGVEVITQEQR